MPMGEFIIEVRAPIVDLLLRPISPIQPTDTVLYALLFQMAPGKLPVLPSGLATHYVALRATPKSPSATRRTSTKRITKKQLAVPWRSAALRWRFFGCIRAPFSLAWPLCSIEAPSRDDNVAVWQFWF